ncbi:MAG: hypothetical protein AAGG11_17920 [Pseudomonadota bacterium]
MPFFSPTPTGSPRQFKLHVVPAATVGPPDRKFLMGGVNLGAALEALEAVAARPTLYASAQFLSFAGLNDRVDIDVRVRSEGRSVTQATALNSVGDRAILRVSAAFGERDGATDVQFVQPPDVPSASNCEPVVEQQLSSDDLGAHIEKRRALEDEASGYAATWIRCNDALPMTSGLIAVIADHLAGALPRTRGASSLDNHLRILNRRETGWLLCETQMLGYSAGFLHGETRLFAEDGVLIALASQSAALPSRGGDWAQTHTKRC